MARLTHTLLRPATWWMQRTRVPMKLVLMGALLIAPVLLLTLQSAHGLRSDLARTHTERQGLAALSHLSPLALQLQNHRSLLARQFAGDAQVASALTDTRRALQTHTEQLDALARPGQPLGSAARWPALRDALGALAKGQHAAQRQSALDQHATLIEQLRQLALELGEHSGLLLDGEAQAYHLADLTVNRLIPWTDHIDRARALGVGLLARGETSATDRATMLGRADALGDLLADMQLREAALNQHHPETLAPWRAARTASAQFEARLRELFSQQVVDAPIDAFHAQGQGVLQAVAQLDTQVRQALDATLAQREQRLQRSLAWQLGGSLLGLALLLYLATAFYRSFIGALSALQQGVTATAGGDLSAKTELPGQDELADIGRSVEGMSARLSAMVADIRSSAVRVGLAGQQVASSSESLSQRTHAQADSLRQTSATVAQLSAAVASNAEAAQTLDQLTDDLRGRAEAGGQAMRDTVGAMAELESGSRRVAEIIGVIDGIAFQTNILALNAAVEAARAGDAGRGFAVVAAEVRQLALRSSTASAEIRQLISQSTQQVSTSVGRIQQVGATLDAVVDGVRDVSQRLRGIAQASAQQSAGLEEVSRSVGNLDELTKQNAAMVRESSAAADDLVARAAALSASVATIRLRQGSADEATALVHRALGLIRERGLEAAAQVFRQADGGFRDRDLYLFVTDREGRYHVHGAKPAMEGHRVHELPGIDGDRFARESWAATEGSHWVEYEIVNPDTGQVQPKASYVVALDKRLLLGCGIYRQVESGSVRAGASPQATTA